MKVLTAIVVPPHLSVSGGARAAELLTSALSRHCDVTVASMMEDREFESARQPGGFDRIYTNTRLPPLVPWSRLPNRYSTLFYRSALPDIIRRESFDLVHLHNPMPALELERAARACRERGIPYVISTHGFNEVANGNEVYGFGPLRRMVWNGLVVGPVSRVVRGAAAVCVLSPADVEIVRQMGFDGDMPVVSNGVALPPPANHARDAKLMGRLGIPARRPGQTTFMFLANHTPNKGLPVLLEAFSRITQPYLLIVAGEMRAEISYDRYVRACHPGQEIIVTDRVSDDAVEALFRRSDIFVFPTLADTFPLAVLEAMSYGLPVIASRIGGIPHQLTDECGVLVPAGDATRLAAAAQMLAVEPDRVGAMGAAARARVAAQFTWEHAADEAFVTYQRVLQRHRHAASAPALVQQSQQQA